MPARARVSIGCCGAGAAGGAGDGEADPTCGGDMLVMGGDDEDDDLEVSIASILFFLDHFVSYAVYK